MIPKAFYEIYAHLAADLDDTSRRISDLTAKIKVRGGYNAANKDIANLLTADDGKLLPVDGVDLMSGGLQNHIWLVPILEWVNALKELYKSRDQQKNAIYEIIGIADIIRGATNPYETATAQRMKGTVGTGRMTGVKASVANFVRDLMRLKSDIIARNFDAEYADPHDRRRSHARRDGHSAQRLLALLLHRHRDRQHRRVRRGHREGSQRADHAGDRRHACRPRRAFCMTGILPPPMIINLTLEMIKMLLHPVRHSRGVIDLIDGYQEMLGAYMQMDPTGALMRPPPPPPPPGVRRLRGAPAKRHPLPPAGAQMAGARPRCPAPKPRRPGWAVLRRDPDHRRLPCTDDEPKRAPTNPNEGMWTQSRVARSAPRRVEPAAASGPAAPRRAGPAASRPPGQPPRACAPDQPREENRIANRDQDPNHPANTTQPWDPNAPTTFSIPPEDLLTTQDADVAAGGNGVGPHEASEDSVPVETMEDLGIGPRHPYPTGNPPPPSEDTKMGQGVWGRTTKEHVKPGEESGPHVDKRDEPHDHDHEKAEDKRKEYPL